MKKTLLLATSLVLAISMVGCLENEESTSENKDTTPAVTTAEEKADVTTKSTEESKEVEEKAEFEVTILSNSIGKDYGKKPILIVEYQFINNSDKATSFSLSIDDTAYQNGVECSSTVISDEIDTQQQLNDIKPGTPYTLKVGYLLADTTTPVEIECYKLMDFSSDKKPLLEQTINLT